MIGIRFDRRLDTYHQKSISCGQGLPLKSRDDRSEMDEFEPARATANQCDEESLASVIGLSNGELMIHSPVPQSGRPFPCRLYWRT